MPLYDRPQATLNALDAIATQWVANQIITNATLNQTLANLGAQWMSTAVWQNANISEGVITLERQARMTYAQLRNEGEIYEDDLVQIDAIPQTPFSDGDYILLRQALPGQKTNILNTSNIAPQNGSFSINDLQGTTLLFMVRGAWVQIAPTNLETILRVLMDYADVTSMPSIVSVFRSMLNLVRRNIGTETRATAIINVTTASGTSGSISVIVDDGTGPISIGTASYTSSTTVAAVLADLETSIDTGGTGYSASVSGSDLTAQAPVGTGAGGNSISISINILGGVSATSPSSFSGGIDASESDGSIDMLQNMTEGKVVFIRNRMENNSIVVTGGTNAGTRYDRELKGGEYYISIGGDSGTAFPLFGCSETKRIVNVDFSMSPYSVKAIDRIIQVDTTGGAVVLDLTPVADFPKGINLVAIKVAGANTLTLDGDGSELIDGSPTLIATRSMIYNDGVEWRSLI